MPYRRLSLLCLLPLGLFVAACADSDTGTCCRTIPGRDATIPTSTTSKTGALVNYRDSVMVDPAYDCEMLTCVAYHSMPAYCTEPCDADSECPKGFSCSTVLDSDPGEGSIKASSRFCVKDGHQCD